MQLLTLPVKDVSDLSTALRNIANRIDDGEFEGAYQIGFIINCGKKISYGLLGKCKSNKAEFNLLLDVAKKSLIASV